MNDEDRQWLRRIGLDDDEINEVIWRRARWWRNNRQGGPGDFGPGSGPGDFDPDSGPGRFGPGSGPGVFGPGSGPGIFGPGAGQGGFPDATSTTSSLYTTSTTASWYTSSVETTPSNGLPYIPPNGGFLGDLFGSSSSGTNSGTTAGFPSFNNILSGLFSGRKRRST